MATLSEAQIPAFNQALLDQLSTPGLEKKAIDAVNDFTRDKMRDDGFYRKILPPLQITNGDLDRQYDTDKPVKIIDKEGDSPASISLPFASLPMNFYILGNRYRCLFQRIVTPRFTKDVDELRTWVMDIRQVMSDNAIKDMLAEEDSVFLGGINTSLVGQDVVLATSGVAQYVGISGGITRGTMQDSFKILPRTPSHLEVHTLLLNNVTIREVMKWGRDEIGGDYSQDLLKNGWSEQEFMNARVLITIKRDLVPDDHMYMFADPKFIGKSYILEDTTMYIKREAFMLEFFAYETIGGALGNLNSFANVSFE
jgi:hypothetical protein